MPSALYYFSTPSIEETRKWLEMTSMALRDFYRLKPLNPQQCLLNFPVVLPNSFNVGGETDRIWSNTSTDNKYGISPDIVHRKSSSMDSQMVAEHNRIANMGKVNTVSSADQIDRLLKEARNGSNGNDFGGDVGNQVVSRLKMAVKINKDHSPSSLISSTINGQSRSSMDLHLSSKSTDHLDSPDAPRRSRSNSTGPTDAINRSRSGSSSRAQSSSKLYGGRHFYTNDTPSTSLEQREICDLRITQGNLDSNPDILEQQNVLPMNEVIRCSSPSTIMTFTNDHESAGMSFQMLNARRFERRYHTSDGIDVTKPKVPANIPPGILKRFSWNVSSAVGGSSRKITNRMNEQNMRRQSQSTIASSESFSSSTSGFSTASSYMEGSGVTEEMTPPGDMNVHISTVAIGEQLEEMTEDTRTLMIQLSDEHIDGIEKDDDKSAVRPPLPDAPPPLSNRKEEEVGTAGAAVSPTTLVHLNTAETSKGLEVAGNLKQQELLKFIMDNHLETSDV